MTQIEEFPSLNSTSILKPALLKPHADLNGKLSGQKPLKIDRIQSVLDLPNQSINRKLGLGSKLTLSDITKKLAIATKVKITTSTSHFKDTTTFIFEGKSGDIDVARRSLIQKVMPNESVALFVPKLALPYVIGTKGKTLNAISDKSGIKITVSNKRDISEQEAAKRFDIEDDQVLYRSNQQMESWLDFDKSSHQESAEADELSELVEITLFGDQEGIQLAQEEIEKIVHEKISTTVQRIDNIPPEYVLLIESLKRDTMDEWMQSGNLSINFPPLHIDFNSKANLQIILRGDRNLVKKAQTDIMEMYEELKRTTIVTSVSVPKATHSYIVGERRQGIVDILQETGCIVIVPPCESKESSIIIRGLPEKLGDAMKKTMDRANQVFVEYIDLRAIDSSASNTISHSRNVMRYLSKKVVGSLEQQFEIKVWIPRREDSMSEDPNVTLEIVGKDRNAVVAARKALVERIQRLFAPCFSSINVDPVAIAHITGQKGRNLHKIHDEFNVELLIPERSQQALSEGMDIVLVYDKWPLPSISEVRRALKDVEERIRQIEATATNIIEKRIPCSHKFHKTIMGTRNSTLNALIGDSEKKVQVIFGPSNGKNTIDEDEILIRGQSEDVNRIYADLTAMVKNIANCKDLEYFETKFHFNSKHIQQLIGKAGSNIQKYREKYDLIMLVRSDFIEIKGVRKNVEEALLKLQAQISQWDDEITEVLKVPLRFHGLLIGHNGRTIKRLSEKYDVKIQVANRKQNASTTELNEDEENTIISGRSKGVMKAKEELLELIQYEEEHDHVLEFEILSEAVPHILGRKGANIESLRQKYDVNIFLSNSNSTETESTGITKVKLKGKEEAIEKVKCIIMEKDAECRQNETRILNIPSKYHRDLLGQKGSRLREILQTTQAKITRDKEDSEKKLPKVNMNVDSIKLKGDPEIIDMITREFQSIVATLDKQVSIKMNLPSSQIGKVIGRGGRSLRETEQRFQVTVDIAKPESSQSQQDMEVLTIRGSPDAVESAKIYIQNNVNDMSSTMFSIPRKFLKALIFCEPDLINKMKTLYSVKIEPQSPLNEVSELLRTDFLDDDFSLRSEDSLYSLDIDSSDEAMFAWNLTGTNENIREAIKLINQYLKDFTDKKPPFFIVLDVRLNSEQKQRMMESWKAHIEQIEQQFGTKIQFKAQDSEVLTIMGMKGSKDDVKRTYKDILGLFMT